MAQVNFHNFLRWQDGALDVAQPYLPRPYQRDTEACDYLPVAYPGEALSFYINNTDGFAFATFSVADMTGLRLDMVHRVTGTATNGVAPLQKHDLPAGRFNLYATVVIPSVVVGQYYFRITRVNAGVPALTSNAVMVRNDKGNLDRETVLLRFRHDRYFYSIRYHELPGFYQQFRVHLNQMEEQFETDRETYRAVTTGKNRTFQSYMNKYHKMEAYYFDRQAMEALAVALEHGELEVNGKRYLIKAGLKIINNPMSKFAKGDFELWSEDFASVNRC